MIKSKIVHIFPKRGFRAFYFSSSKFIDGGSFFTLRRGTRLKFWRRPGTISAPPWRKFWGISVAFLNYMVASRCPNISVFVVQFIHTLPFQCREDGPKYLLPINCKIRGGFAPLHFCVASEHIGQWKTRAVSAQLIPHLCGTNRKGRSRENPQWDAAIIAELFWQVICGSIKYFWNI